MKKNNFTSRFLPHIVAISIFLAVSAICFAPQFLGQKLLMHDVVQFEGMSSDIADLRKEGVESYWTGGMFSGMPSYYILAPYKAQFIPKIRKVTEFLGYPASLIFMAMVCFYLMLCMGRVKPWLAIVPSLAYGLSTYFFLIIGAGHVMKMVAMAYLPLLLGAIYYAYRRNVWLGAALAAFAATIQIASNHPQITFYFVLVIAAFIINELIISAREKAIPKFLKTTGILAVAALLAVGANWVSLYNNQQHAKDTMRGGTELTNTLNEEGEIVPLERKGKGLDIGYATKWSYGVDESLNMLVPNFMGGESGSGFSPDGEVADVLRRYDAIGVERQLPSYWGEQPITGGPTYLGASVILLAVMSLFLVSGRKKWWVVAITLLAIMLSWGYHMMWLTELFFNYFPLYNKFRTVSMIQVIVQWSVPLLAAYAMCSLWDGDVDRKRKMHAAKMGLYIVGGLTLFLALFGGAVFDFVGPHDRLMRLPEDVLAAMRKERIGLMKADAWRSLFFVLTTAGAAMLFVYDKVKGWVAVSLLALLVVLDLGLVNSRYMPYSKFINPADTKTKPTIVDLAINNDKELGYRVLNVTVSPFNDATTSCFHRSVGGYHGAKLQRYQDLIDWHLSRGNQEVYNMLNTKYTIGFGNEEQTMITYNENPGKNGTAWFVDELRWVDNADQEIESLYAIDTKREAVVDRRFEDVVRHSGVNQAAIAKDSTDDAIEMTDYRADRVKYRYSAAGERVAVFSEVYYADGWEAFIDGEPSDHFRVDYILRAMILPAGEHEIEFRFEPPHLKRNSIITTTFSIIIVIWLAGAMFFPIFVNRRERKGDAEE